MSREPIPKQASALQALTRKENWAIYLLRGWKVLLMKYLKPVLDTEEYLDLDIAINRAIAAIRYEQSQRK